MFVLAEVVCSASPIPYASLGNDEVFQKNHWKKFERDQDLEMSGNRDFE